MTSDTHIPTSIIIPSLNSPVIDRVVQAVAQQDGFTKDDEIIVVGKDDSSLLSRHDGLRFIDTVHPVDASTARNIGIESAKGDLLVFLDSDCFPQPGWLNEHRLAQGAGFVVVGGGVQPVGDNYWHRTYNLTMFHDVFSTASPGYRPFLPTLNLSVQRYVIEHVGGLDVSLPYSHDVDWTTRMREAGFRPYFWPKAAIRHQHNRVTMRQVWHDCAINGHYARLVRLKHRSTLHTPLVLRYRRMTILLSPIIAAWVTVRIIISQPSILLQNVKTIPAIYLTKIAWCWGTGW